MSGHPKYDITGKVFGRLTAIKREVVVNPSGKRLTKWWCQCECGGTAFTTKRKLETGHTKSCGCYFKERVTKHSMCGTRVYHSWYNMKDRCTNRNNPQFKDYGGRGITYDPKWETFEGFYEDMGERPEKLTLDRINNNGNYEKGNCRWATYYQQNSNLRRRSINTSGKTGVYQLKGSKRWHAEIGSEGVKYYLGSFEEFQNAVNALRSAELKHFGKYSE